MFFTRIKTISITSFLFISIISGSLTAKERTLTPEAFLTYQNDIQYKTRHYVRNLCFSVGAPIVASGVLLYSDDQNRQIDVAVYGGIYLGLGALFHVAKFPVEKEFEKYKKDPNYSAAEATESVRKQMMINRYISGGLLLLPVFFSPPESSNSSENSVTMAKVVAASASMACFFIKNPIEKQAEEVLVTEKRRLSLHFQPAISKQIVILYKF